MIRIKYPRALHLGAVIFLINAITTLNAKAWEPLKSNSQNPYIFDFREESNVLGTFGEHYGSVINSSFDYKPYLDILQRDGMNLTRVFLVGFRITDTQSPDPLAPSATDFIQPWPRTMEKGAALDGLGKWDLSQWNPSYFSRLGTFLYECSARDIVAELSFFCTFYTEEQWQASPLNPANNVQGLGPANRYDCMRGTNTALMSVQEAVVSKIVKEVNASDNIYFEIQNEPFWNEPNLGDSQEVDFHNKLLTVIRNAELSKKRHLIAHNYPQKITALSSDFDIISEHYPIPLPFANLAGGTALITNYSQSGHLLSLGETLTTTPEQTRLEAWMFLLGGGASYNGLDYGDFVYSNSYEAGDTQIGRAHRRAVKGAISFIAELDRPAMRRDTTWVTAGLPTGATIQAISKPGQQYAAYIHHGYHDPSSTELSYTSIDAAVHTAALTISIPTGTWRAVWTRPIDGAVVQTQAISPPGSSVTLDPVNYQQDVALRIDRTGPGDLTAPPPPRRLISKANTDSSVSLTWNKVDAQDLAGYRLYRSQSDSVPIDLAHRVAQVASDSTSYIDTTATIGGSFRYVVTAIDTNQNESLPSRSTITSFVTGAESPIANAGADINLVDSDGNGSESFNLNASGSKQGSAPLISYQWSNNGTIIASDMTANIILPIGLYRLELVVVDANGLKSTDELIINIRPTSLLNGSFETGLNGWIAKGNVLVQSTSIYLPTSETKLATFNSSDSIPNGSIAQSMMTIPGERYSLSFDLGVVSLNSQQQSMKVEIVGATVISSTAYQLTGIGGGKNVWSTKSLVFTASSPVTTISFTDTSTVTASIDLLLDNVQVAPLAEPFNTAPVAASDSYEAIQDTPLVIPNSGVLANDSDAESDKLSAFIVTKPLHGSLNLETAGGFSYTPSAGYSGEDSFTYYTSDGKLSSNVTSVMISIKAVSNSLLNGSFENGLTGWISSGNVNVQSGSIYQATDGTKLGVFNGGDQANTGFLSQSFQTNPGVTYTLQFDAGVVSYNLNSQSLLVTVTGDESLLSKVITIAGLGNGLNRWLPQSFEFVANSTTTAISLQDKSSTSISIDLIIDHIRISSSNQPSAILPLNGKLRIDLLPGELWIRLIAPDGGLYTLEHSQDLYNWAQVDEKIAGPGPVDFVQRRSVNGAPLKAKDFFRVGFQQSNTN